MSGQSVSDSFAEQITSAPIFHQRLRWTGEAPPPERESKILWDLLRELGEQGPERGVQLVEIDFIQRFPNSAWTPSLRANLAQFYRKRGLYSKALEHWEAAWPELRDVATPQARKVRNFALSHWVNFLSSLGRLDRLKELFEENGEDKLDGGPFYQLYVRGIEAAQRMVREPGAAYRCGNFALASVSDRMGLEKAKVTAIKQLRSPETGFALSDLGGVASNYGLDLVAVRRKRNDALVAPAVIHWKTDHYAALLEIDGDWGYVVDPTFGGPKWLRLDYVNQEVSGNFLIPSDNVSSLWEQLSQNQAARIFGRGFPNAFDDNNDAPCPDDSNPDREETDSGAPVNEHNPNKGQDCVECPSGDGGGGGFGEPCDEHGNEDPRGYETDFDYCECGSLDSVTNPLNKTTSYVYDFNGRLITVIQDNGDEMNYYYHLDGRLDYIDDNKDASSEWEFVYNNQGLIEEVTSDSGTILSVDYNHLDHPVEVTRANGVTIDQSFDNAGRLEERDYPDGGEETFVWNARGLEDYTFKETGGTTRTTSFEYDELGRRTLLTNANNEEIEYTYNAFGNLKTLTDGKNQTTTWVYDTEGRWLTKTNQAGVLVQTNLWNANGELTERWTPKMETTQYTYDDNGNLTDIDYPAGTTDISYTYDAADQLIEMNDALGETIFTYTDNDQLHTEEHTGWASSKVTYTYTIGYRTKLALQQPSASDWEIDYDYDADRRLDWIDSTAGTFEYSYVNASRSVNILDLPGGQYVDYEKCLGSALKIQIYIGS